MASLKEKIGYGLGDMSTSMFWKIFSFYLPIFYSDVFGLPLAAAATLMLVTRLWDAVSDPMMGVIADRTNSRAGKYRPYLLWMAIPFAVAGCLLFTTPDFGDTGKLIWAYATYILMMTVYTAINVPYSSMLAVITRDSDEKTVFSSYRMFFAYTGSFIALFAWEPLCHFFERGHAGAAAVQSGWQNSMFVLAIICVALFFTCYSLTREKFTSEKAPSTVKADFKALIKNRPWWILTAAALCSNLFNTVRGGTVAYYFKYYIGDGASISFGPLSFLFFAGLFLALGEVCNMVGVVCAVPVSKWFGKRNTMVLSSITLALLSVMFFFVPCSPSGFLTMLALQILISIVTGIISPLIWSMYADVADNAMNENGISSAGLIFSSGSMAQKFGGALAGWGLIVTLDLFGLVPNAPEQTTNALLGLQMAMSVIPAAVAILMGVVMVSYPLGRKPIFSFSKLSAAAVALCLVTLSANAEDASNFANFKRYEAANQQLAAAPRVVLMGNSITDFWPRRGSHLFESHPEIVGRGIAGQTSYQFLLRFRRDVVELHPEIVVINYGTNDIALNSGPYNEDLTFGNVLSMVDIARANGIKVVLASTLPAEGFSWRPEVTDAMDKIRSLNARVRAYADANGIPYADYYSALVNEDGTAMADQYADERPAVHPNKAGYSKMEEILLEAIGKLSPETSDNSGCSEVPTGPVWGKIYPERRDDIAYENQLGGYRIYGPATRAAGERAFGYDIFFKYPSEEIILPELYKPETDPAVWQKVDSLRAVDPAQADEFINSFSYHIDHGKGFDPFPVGPTLGAGVAARLVNDSIVYPWCYESAEILENGPQRFTVALHFADGEHRLISLDSGSYLNRCEVWYDNLIESQPIVVGFPLRDESKPYASASEGIVAYSSPVSGDDSGRALLGIYRPEGFDATITLDNHILGKAEIAPREHFIYYWGFAWDETDIHDLEHWVAYLKTLRYS